jgi:hypothetical protein
MRQLHLLLRYLWAAPATSIGLLLAALATCAGARVRLVGGTCEVAGGRLPRLIGGAPACARFVAITLGHVIIGVDHAVLSQVRAHEQVHVRQYERWGVLFFPLYLGSSLVQWLRGCDPYRDNRFEREAYARSAPPTLDARLIARDP